MSTRRPFRRPFTLKPKQRSRDRRPYQRHLSVSGKNYAIIRRLADERGVPMSTVVTEMLERAMAAS